jgi:putative tricarboxylic transport membrane protein
MRTLDVAPAVVMLGLSAVVYGATRDMPYWSEFTPGPAFLPTWVAGAGVLISIVILAQAFRKGGTASPEWPDRAGGARVLLTTAGLVLCVPLAPHLGFVVIAVIFMLGMMLGIFRRKLVPSLLMAVGIGALIHGVFVWWLKVALPSGPLGF